MSISSAHCALGHVPLHHRPHLRRHGERDHAPAPIRVPAGSVRWERPHDHERRRRRLIGGL